MEPSDEKKQVFCIQQLWGQKLDTWGKNIWKQDIIQY